MSWSRGMQEQADSPTESPASPASRAERVAHLSGTLGVAGFVLPFCTIVGMMALAAPAGHATVVIISTFVIGTMLCSVGLVFGVMARRRGIGPESLAAFRASRVGIVIGTLGLAFFAWFGLSLHLIALLSWGMPASGG